MAHPKGWGPSLHQKFVHIYLQGRRDAKPRQEETKKDIIKKIWGKKKEDKTRSPDKTRSQDKTRRYAQTRREAKTKEETRRRHIRRMVAPNIPPKGSTCEAWARRDAKPIKKIWEDKTRREAQTRQHAKYGKDETRRVKTRKEVNKD